MDEKAKKRFFDKVVVNPETGCWEWTACRNRDGYGRFKLDGRKRYAHRVAYELIKGKIPEGLQIDHLCRVRACVNPDHLEPVTCRENLHRGETFNAANAAKTHCPQGHPLSGDNLYVRPDGRRGCKTCQAEHGRRYWAKKKKNTSPASTLKTHCKHGHPFSGDNLHVAPNGRRVCKACSLERARRHRAKQRKGADLANEADALPTTKGENDGQ